MRKYKSSRLIIIFSLIIFPFTLKAQVNSVVFGQNRLQFNKFQWKFFQSHNFNTYVTKGGTELGKFAAQLAEEELPSIEAFTEFSLQHRAELIVYNNYDDYKQSNIGLGTEWQNAGGLTTLVNNKIVVFFDGNHNHLRLQIRQGIAKVLTSNILFGENIGEVASNQALLDLPQWLTDGYIAYAAEPWNTNIDDELKEIFIAGNYEKFNRFAFKKPLLAGHAFWFYFSRKYKPENVTYFLTLARMYKSLNQASLKICKKKFKQVLADFMEDEGEKYDKDVAKRKNNPKGNISASEDVSDDDDFYRFQVNPNAKNNTYAEVEFKKGIYKVKLVDPYGDDIVLLERGVRTKKGDINPNYPILSWDVKGRNLLVIYWEKGKTKMFVWDVVAGYRKFRQSIDYFEQILDASFMLDANTLVLSAVKNGHSDIFTYKIDEREIKQITNDVYDDLNPTFVSFPNRSGIIFSSNRPGNDAPNKDTVLPSRYRFNIFLVDILNNGPTKQITQLTNMKHGNATYPMQYNTSHFTFVSDESGIANRWAGFFSTQRNGLDTLYKIGDELLRNPTPQELDSTLAAWQKQEPDSIGYYQAYKDSAYSFPLTDYSNSILETRIAGNNGQISETKLDGDTKNLYKLKINEAALHDRTVNPRPTEYMKTILQEEKAREGKATVYDSKEGKKVESGESNEKKPILFQSEFADEKPDSFATALIEKAKEPIAKQSYLSNTKMFNYRYHFYTDNVMAGLSNNVLINRYQPYMGGYGPIILNSGGDLNLTFKVGTSELFEDIKFMGGIAMDFSNFASKDFFLNFQNNKRMIDWGFTYYRSNVGTYVQMPGIEFAASANQYTNLYQFNFSLPINEVKSIRANIGYRTDRIVTLADGMELPAISQQTLSFPDTASQFLVSRLEYVHDNTVNPTQNIWDGLRYKVYLDINTPVGNPAINGKNTYNFGWDVRYYKPIYRNFIWAFRSSADFSWGKQKIVYYLGGVDGWFNPQFNYNKPPAQDQTYAFQSLAVNMRGYNQNIANGNNAMVFNSEFRLPVFSTFIQTPINNAFVRNFQLVQFFDMGTAWNGKYNGIQRPYQDYSDTSGHVTVRIDAGGLGPFAAGYGFGARSNILGYFAKLDVAWPMLGVFRGKPIWYFALGFDF